MKTKYLILLSIPYLTAYYLLFISATTQSIYLEEKSTAQTITTNQKIKITNVSNLPVTVDDTIATKNKKQ
ncbi:MAG TPA: hypothetical protein PLX60_12600 [Chitinophagales bacterium]|jgi:hypothetical protein|nr:hypothetical protein [Chitinophagales bacterium]